MAPLNFDYQHPLFHKTIQLYGDRVGGQGNFEFAGIAELNQTKLILLHGNTQSLVQPADWRRLQRLTSLAERLKKPVVLWNIHIENAATMQHHTSLTLATVIQNTKIHLLKMQQPIVAVYDHLYEWGTKGGESGWEDGLIIANSHKGKQHNEDSQSKQHTLKIVCEKDAISKQLVKLLDELSKKPIEELTTDRIQSLCSTFC